MCFTVSESASRKLNYSNVQRSYIWRNDNNLIIYIDKSRVNNIYRLIPQATEMFTTEKNIQLSQLRIDIKVLKLWQRHTSVRHILLSQYHKQNNDIAEIYK